MHPAPCTPDQTSIPWLKEGWRQVSYSAYCMWEVEVTPYPGLDRLIWVCPYIHPKTLPGRGPEFPALLLSPAGNHPAWAEDTSGTAARQSMSPLPWLPDTVPRNAQRHSATIL